MSIFSLKVINRLLSNFKNDNVILLSEHPLRVNINGNIFIINNNFSVSQEIDFYLMYTKLSSEVEQKLKI